MTKREKKEGTTPFIKFYPGIVLDCEPRPPPPDFALVVEYKAVLLRIVIYQLKNRSNKPNRTVTDQTYVLVNFDLYLVAIHTNHKYSILTACIKTVLYTCI